MSGCCGPKTDDDVRKDVSESYAKIANDGGNAGCCLPATSGPDTPSAEAFAKNFGYSDEELAAVPDGANMGLGCGNPSAIAAMKAGEVVVDLGSGGGFDCFLAAKQVGEDGFVIGVDMTHDMLRKAKDNADKLKASNVEFRLGEIENLPIGDNTADVIISNCVVNLSPRKHRVIEEAFRVLKPGGRVAISDVVETHDMPEDIQNDTELLCGCVSGAAAVKDLQEWLKAAGFCDIKIDIKEESRDYIKDWAPGRGIEQYVASASIEAVKPNTKCCG
ncbi:putative Arsenite methyltransferase [Candidatus Terasakiella magnetica]|uniref:Arsenite methyltransferase n=1 Tax=Candidatus Terasakiella magnetica TaxID=1867952 RepID=A0A1C3RCR0_9PROT|nr:arsenite methyltransferase [Candidatus Terasakiella magnetica]SCA55067.1 putative Arsenite methyltransferase [Candidatus Terasakiella magnetica]